MLTLTLTLTLRPSGCADCVLAPNPTLTLTQTLNLARTRACHNWGCWQNIVEIGVCGAKLCTFYHIFNFRHSWTITCICVC